MIPRDAQDWRCIHPQFSHSHITVLPPRGLDSIPPLWLPSGGLPFHAHIPTTWKFSPAFRQAPRPNHQTRRKHSFRQSLHRISIREEDLRAGPKQLFRLCGTLPCSDGLLFQTAPREHSLWVCSRLFAYPACGHFQTSAGLWPLEHCIILRTALNLCGVTSSSLPVGRKEI